MFSFSFDCEYFATSEMRSFNESSHIFSSSMKCSSNNVLSGSAAFLPIITISGTPNLRIFDFEKLLNFFMWHEKIHSLNKVMTNCQLPNDYYLFASRKRSPMGILTRSSTKIESCTSWIAFKRWCISSKWWLAKLNALLRFSGGTMHTVYGAIANGHRR